MAEAVDIFQVLKDLNIPFELQEHKAIYSEEDSKDVVITLEGTDVKNLFVKDKNKNYGLVSYGVSEYYSGFCNAAMHYV